MSGNFGHGACENVLECLIANEMLVTMCCIAPQVSLPVLPDVRAFIAENDTTRECTLLVMANYPETMLKTVSWLFGAT